jgi:serine/threonine-protein kinase ULK/ATG1
MLKGNKIKIGDFGFAKKAETSKMMSQTIVGSPLYMPIQVLKSESYSSKCDIWALGCIYYEMLHGYPPWQGKSEYELVKKIETKPL